MKTIFRTVRMAFMCSLLVALTSCVGPGVSKESHYPTPDPKIELRLKTDDPVDVLVIYNDPSRKSDKTTRRGFYLFANRDRLDNFERPKFVNLSQTDHFPQIPIFKTNLTGHITNEIYAVEIKSPQFTELSLVSHDHELLKFPLLPDYEDEPTGNKWLEVTGKVVVAVVVYGAWACLEVMAHR